MMLRSRPFVSRALAGAAMVSCSLVSVLTPAPAHAEAAVTAADVRQLVVKIHTTQRFPDVLRPWTQQEAQKVSGSGAIIQGRRILTNAHVVRNATEIYVQPYQSSDMLDARVVGFAPGMDLALLELQDPSFFDSRGFIAIEEAMPNVKDVVNVYGYPMGGDELSVTQGIVSRIEFTGYNYGAAGLRVQVDAALNPGNSGGPAIAGGKLIGLVFSGIPSSQNIGYLIPSEEVNLFLQDVADGKYNGKPMLLDSLQTVENSALRDKLALPRDKGGLMVIEPYDENEGQYPLRRWDVITQIGDYPLDSQGNVKISDNLRLDAKYLLQELARDGRVALKVWRDAREIEVTAPLSYTIDRVIPFLFNDRPEYFIYGPFVFAPATQELFGRLSDRGRGNFARIGSSLVSRVGDKPEFDGEEIVIVCSRMFPHPITKGYDEPYLSVVEEVNGVKVRNLRHLVELLRDMKDQYVALKFEGRGLSAAEIPVFEHQKMLAATEDILTDNGIRSPYSETIGRVWKNQP